MSTRTLGILIALWCSGCVILVDAGADGGSNAGGLSNDGGGWVTPVDAGSGTGPGLPDGGPGAPDGGWAPPPDAGMGAGLPPFPGSGRQGTGTIGIIWLVRVDLGLANLADMYEEWMNKNAADLRQHGFEIGGTAIAPLYGGDGTFLYAESTQNPATSRSISDALRFFASQADSFPVAACTTTNALDLGVNYAWVYDFTNNNTSSPAVSRQPLFNPFPAVILVGLLDSNARPDALTAPACQVAGDSPAYQMGAKGPGSMVRILGGLLPRGRVRYLFVATPEGGVSAESLRTQCLADSSWPAGASDAIGPSPALFFTPLAKQLPDNSLGLDLCTAPTTQGDQQLNSLYEDWVIQLITNGGMD